MKHFIEELRRRGVLRAGLVYLASSWLVVQVLETLVPIFGLPETSIRWVVITLAERAPFDGPLTLRLAKGTAHVGPALASRVMVEILPD